MSSNEVKPDTIDEHPLMPTPEFYESPSPTSYLRRLSGNLDVSEGLVPITEYINASVEGAVMTFIFKKTYKNIPLFTGLFETTDGEIKRLTMNSSLLREVSRNKIVITLETGDTVKRARIKVYSIDLIS
jgi:hypothetical protein